VGPRACLDDMEKIKFLALMGLELRPLGRPTRSQSLYRLSKRGSCNLLCLLRVASYAHTNVWEELAAS
jgi:hypothetical protein